MEIVWDNPGISALELDEKLKVKGVSYGNNLYSYLSRCQKKGALRREDPGYHCWPLIERQSEQSLLDRILSTLFHGTPVALVETLVKDEKLSDAELKQIKEIINRIDSDEK